MDQRAADHGNRDEAHWEKNLLDHDAPHSFARQLP
jgi:hypothetical protein